jgi:hypothetical protein
MTLRFLKERQNILRNDKKIVSKLKINCRVEKTKEDKDKV